MTNLGCFPWMRDPAIGRWRTAPSPPRISPAAVAAGIASLRIGFGQDWLVPGEEGGNRRSGACLPVPPIIAGP